MKIYIVAPANNATGGPELLHQFAKKLLDKHIQVEMFYLPNDEINPIHNNYIEYSIPYTAQIEDNKDNILLVPEVFTDILKDYNSIKKAVWWLSVDNYFFTLPKLKGKTNARILHYLNSQNYLFFDNTLKSPDIVHLYQSEYARLFLQNKGIDRIYQLSDYLHPSFLKKSELLYGKVKQDIVVYNPLKGKKFTNQIIEACTNINFVPIQNMTRDEVVKLLASSKVYIDFGFHPGKDRIPREAVVLGNCILTNRKGSANNRIDIPINDEFKFSDRKENLMKIKKKLEQLLKNYNTEKLKFTDYRNEILLQETKFNEEVENFIRLFIR